MNARISGGIFKLMMLCSMLSLLIVSSPRSASAVAAWPLVVEGNTGPNVKTVQYFLRHRGYSSVVADGAFGPGTKSAVVSFQQANALTADGAVGANTWAKLAVTVDVGANNEAVKGLQTQLVKHGYSVAVDGAYGPGTQTAVNDFKAKHFLSGGTVVGATTWQELTGSGNTSGGGGTRAQLAATIRDSSRIGLATSHPSGVIDNAYPRTNIVDTANGGMARRSCYGNAPCGSVYLQTSMLNGMISLSNTYTYFVSSIAGASHSATSRHYDGVAIDVTSINGIGVSSSNPHQSAYRSRCSALGATEVLGPGNADHSTHIHCAWPRP